MQAVSRRRHDTCPRRRRQSCTSWLYVTGFVEPATGRTVWNVSNNISKAYFELVLADFAKSIGAGKKKRIVLQLDNAGWHGPENLIVPDGIRLVFQPAHSPVLQPAEHLWAFVDEPLVNRYFETIEDLDQVVGERCVALIQQQQMIRDSTLFHWWPGLKAHTPPRRRPYETPCGAMTPTVSSCHELPQLARRLAETAAQINGLLAVLASIPAPAGELPPPP